MKIDAAVSPMIMWYSQSCYAKFESIGYEAALEAAQAASDFNSREPLLMRTAKGEFSTADIPHFDECTGPFCIALLAAFLVWTQHIGQGTHDAIYLPESLFLDAAEEGYQMWRMLQ